MAGEGYPWSSGKDNRLNFRLPKINGLPKKLYIKPMLRGNLLKKGDEKGGKVPRG